MAMDGSRIAVALSTSPYLIFTCLKTKMEYHLKLLLPASTVAISSTKCISASNNIISIFDISPSKLKDKDIQKSHIDATDITVSLESVKHLSFLDISTLLIMCSNGDWFIYCLLTMSTLSHTTSVRGLSAGNCYRINRNSWKISGGYKDGNVRSWIVCFDRQKSTFSITPMPLLCSLGDHITCIEMYGNIVLSGSWDAKVRIWESRSSNRGMTLRRTLLNKANHSPIMSLTFDNDTIITGHYNGTITVWDFSLPDYLNPRHGTKRVKI